MPMKVAAPLYRGRVAPHFATAPDLLIALIQQKRIIAIMELRVEGQSLAERQHKIVAMGADLLLCGGIEERARHFLERRGVRVMADLKGPLAEVLQRVLGISAETFGRQVS